MRSFNKKPNDAMNWPGTIIAITVLLIPLVIAVVILSPFIVTGLIYVLIHPYRKKRFLRKYRGKIILVCTGNKFYPRFVNRNRKQLMKIIDKVVYLDDVSGKRKKRIDWDHFIQRDGGFPVIIYIDDELKQQNLREDFFRFGKNAEDQYYLSVLSTIATELRLLPKSSLKIKNGGSTPASPWRLGQGAGRPDLA